jgi:hypothetical protein
MAKVSLTIKKKNEDGKAYREEEVFEIDRVSTWTMLKLKSEITGIMKEIKGNGDLVTVINDFMNGQMKPGEEAVDIKKVDLKDVKASDLEKLKDERFINTMAGALELLLDTMPDRAFRLLALLSEIDQEVLQNTYFEELFDVYDAVMAENDISRIVDRVKKSFSGTKDNWKVALSNFLNKK